MPRTTDARAKAIATTERLFRVQGYAATGLTQIITESGAPKGSFYFHFPGGKRELATVALAHYRERTTAGFRAIAGKADGDPDRLVRLLTTAVAEEMAASGWNAGCLAQTLAQELAPHDTAMADALAEVFAEWTSIIAPVLGSDRALALVAALEGARTLARTQRSAEPFTAVITCFGLSPAPN